MHFWAAADTDIGIRKSTNQDACLIRHARVEGEEILLAAVCDGMGGLEKGELASATAVRALTKWFDEEICSGKTEPDPQKIGEEWVCMLKYLNSRIGAYGREIHMRLGTTFTGVLMTREWYVIAHVGDSRLYYLGDSLTQLTEDQTFVAREVKCGNMTPQQARTDQRRNILLQCVGASAEVEPQVLTGKLQCGSYLLCTDGFRHVNTPDEIFAIFRPAALSTKEDGRARVRYMIDQTKARNERDNISALLINVFA